MADPQDERGAQRETEDLLSGFDRPQRPSRRSGPSSEDFVDYHERVSSEPIAPPRSRPLPRAKTTSAAIPKNELPRWVKWAALAAALLGIVAIAAWNLTPAPPPPEVRLPPAVTPTSPTSLPPQAPMTAAIPDPDPGPAAPAPVVTTPKATARRDVKPPKPEASAAPPPPKATASGYVRDFSD